MLKKHPDLWGARGLTLKKHPDLWKGRELGLQKYPDLWEMRGVTVKSNPIMQPCARSVYESVLCEDGIRQSFFYFIFQKFI